MVVDARAQVEQDALADEADVGQEPAQRPRLDDLDDDERRDDRVQRVERRVVLDDRTDPVVDRATDDQRHRETGQRVDDHEDGAGDHARALRTDEVGEQTQAAPAQEDGQARRHLLFVLVDGDAAPASSASGD